MTPEQIQEQAEKFVKEELEIIDKTLHQHDCIVSFTEGAKWMQEQERIFEIDFGGNVLVKIKIKDNRPAIEGCINGYGDAISMDKIIIRELPQQPPVIRNGRWKCMLCGRDKFTHKSPHKCVGGYRKRKIIWQEIENHCA